MIDIDGIDGKLLALLQRDATQSTAQLAEQVGISQSPCWRRINRLESAGAIQRRVAILDRKALGFGVEVFVRIKLSDRGLRSTEALEAAILKLPEVLECHMLLGEIDYRLRVALPSLADYERFLRDKLATLPGVRDIESSVVISEVKNETALPLGRLG